jgi:hypothetical protein
MLPSRCWWLQTPKSAGEGPLFPRSALDGYGKRMAFAPKELSYWLRNGVHITDPRKPVYRTASTAPSFLRNTRLPDGSLAVKEDIALYLTGHTGSGAHAGYGKRWIETSTWPRSDRYRLVGAAHRFTFQQQDTVSDVVG